MGSIQNLIVCVKMAWSEHLDCGVNIRYNYTIIRLYDFEKTKSVEFSAKNSLIPLIDKRILVYFVRSRLHPVCN